MEDFVADVEEIRKYCRVEQATTRTRTSSLLVSSCDPSSTREWKACMPFNMSATVRNTYREQWMLWALLGATLWRVGMDDVMTNT